MSSSVMQSKIKKEFDQILKPVLDKHGFCRVELKSCIHEEQLWRNGRLWFGVSLDWRDQYFEAYLGHLYWFRDVIPRVIILGEYSSYANFDPYKLFRSDGLVKTLEAIAQTFDQALKKYDRYYDDILKSKLQPKKTKYAKEYIMALGEEVKEQELQKYYA
jgi:hypothetical protein